MKKILLFLLWLPTVACAGSISSFPINTTPLPVASTTVSGTIKVDGTTTNVSNGILSANPVSYTLPVASPSQLGGVMVDGTTITINSGIISSVGGSGGGVTSVTALGPVQNSGTLANPQISMPDANAFRDGYLTMIDWGRFNSKQAAGSYVNQSTTINGHALNANVTLTTGDIGAVPTARSINGNPLTTDITLTPWNILGNDIYSPSENTDTCGGGATKTFKGTTYSGSFSEEQAITLGSGTCTIAFTQTPSATTYVKLRIVQGASGISPTWTAVKWPSGTAPTITTTNGATDFVSCKLIYGVGNYCAAAQDFR